MWILLTALLAAASGNGEAASAARAARDLASRELGVPADKLAVVSVEAAEWRDTSLGCPRKGSKYSAAVSPGHKVVLKSGGKQHEVHVSGARAVLCESKGEHVADEARVYELARADLARRLGIAEDSVKAHFIRPQKWPDASLGCPQPDTMYAQVETPGFLIELEAAGKTYSYHSDRKSVVLCP
ncbi:MAG TPA: hypothetical protein VFE90_10745 [Myxococcales bacterium]|jgi:hypothetical protein|nr:hypothetical protein [Myxococcales bacterium]